MRTAAPRGFDLFGRRGRAADRRGVYAPFISVIAAALLLLGGIAYDAPRLTAARQDALHAANEAARVAAAVIAAGGTLADARSSADERLAESGLIYGYPIHVVDLECVGNRAQVAVLTGYLFRSVLGIARPVQPIKAIGAAEAVLLDPGGEPAPGHLLGECPL